MAVNVREKHQLRLSMQADMAVYCSKPRPRGKGSKEYIDQLCIRITDSFHKFEEYGQLNIIENMMKRFHEAEQEYGKLKPYDYMDWLRIMEQQVSPECLHELRKKNPALFLKYEKYGTVLVDLPDEDTEEEDVIIEDEIDEEDNEPLNDEPVDPEDDEESEILIGSDETIEASVETPVKANSPLPQKQKKTESVLVKKEYVYTRPRMSINELMRVVRMHKRKLERLPEDSCLAERDLCRKTEEEIEAIFQWGKDFTSKPDFRKAQKEEDGIRIRMEIKNTSGLEFAYIKIPICVYDENNELIDTFNLEVKSWKPDAVWNFSYLIKSGQLSKGKVDYRNLVYEIEGGIKVTVEELEERIVDVEDRVGEEKQTLLLTTYVAGTTYVEDCVTLLKALKKGSVLTLKREPENPHDSQAILVLNQDGQKIGYIPRNQNTVIANMMDAGKDVYAVVSNDRDDETLFNLNMDIFLREN